MMDTFIGMIQQEAAPAQWVFFFYIYCFIGWIWECFYVSVHEKRWVNRGFMRGPLLPIYGSGAIILLILTLPVRGNYIMMVVIGMASAAVLEYATGAVMEALFRVRYWDYTGRFLNLNGYICFASVACWGVMTFVVTGFVHPKIASVVALIPGHTLEVADYVITALAGADFAVSFKTAIDFRNVLIRAEKAREELLELRSRMDELQKQLAENAAEAVETARDKAAETMEAAKDKAMETVGTARDRATETAEAAKDKMAETAAAAKGKMAETAAAARAKASWELQELKLREQLSLSQVRSLYSKGIGRLLDRNPGAVSFHHKDVFPAVKEALAGYGLKRKNGISHETPEEDAVTSEKP